MQQGRVQLDADWNEQLDLGAHRDRADVVDTVGSTGVPKEGGGFEVTISPDGTDLLLSPGRAWIGGHLCELGGELTTVTSRPTATSVSLDSLVLNGEEIRRHDWVEVRDPEPASVIARVQAIDVEHRILTLSASVAPLAGELVLRRRASYGTQPDLPQPDRTSRASSTEPAVLDLGVGSYLAYLDVWERTITALDDPTISEPALGVDTTTRSQVVWQLRLLDLTDVPEPIDCASDVSEAMTALRPSTGRMAARAEEPAESVDLCRPTPAGGYVGLENQLYRVQVHDLDGDRPVVVWSRENASVVSRWLGNTATDILDVSSIGRDAVLGFGPGDWVELYDDECVLHQRPGTLVRLLKAVGSQLTLDLATATGSTDIADFPLNAMVRRWDSPGAVPAPDDAWIPVENGVEVRFPLGGVFHRHDYWLVPARSAQADVDWVRDSVGTEIALLPSGTPHAIGKLGLIRRTVETVAAEDCRGMFPALTALTAADVTVDNEICDLPDVDSVQDAIDALCRANDLRRHNRLLHGYGIVNGLAVHCGDRTDGTGNGEQRPRRFVTVRPGSAIDCEGNDIDVAEAVLVDVLKDIDGLDDDVLDSNGDGEVSLVLRTSGDAGRRVAVRPYVPRTESQLLDGTLLGDIYQDCVAELYEWIRDQLEPSGEDPRADQKAYRLRTALTNLAAYPANPKSGGTIFVSADEDELVRDFYAALRQRLRSATFCAMFDDARPYPDYPRSLQGINSISGSGGHSRVRVHPLGKEAYTVGSGINPAQPASLINRYDLGRGVLKSRIDPVSGREVELGDRGSKTTAAVTDVAFSPDGRRIYVAVPTRDGTDTLFRVGDIATDTIRWRPATTICGVKLVTLVTTEADPDHVYAVGVRLLPSRKTFELRDYTGAGIFRIPPDDVPDDLQAIASTQELNTSGHLEISPEGVAVFTCGEPGESAATYSRLAALNLTGDTLVGQVSIDEGSDGITLLTDARRNSTSVWAVVGSGTRRSLTGFDVRRLDRPLEQFPVPDAAGSIALRAVGTRIVLTESDTSTARVLDPATGFVDGLLLPLQLGPSSVSTSARNPRQVVVLNRLSNSLSLIDAELVLASTFDLRPLTAYRRAAVEAFSDLLGGFLQYLKDCVCDHLLISPPECPQDRDLDLAAVSIRGNSVHKVCNWSRRRYVKSFPTVGYWLSLVPVLPVLREFLGRACCALLTEFFGRYDATDDADDRIPTEAILRLLEIAQEEDPFGRLRGSQKTLRTAGAMAIDGQPREAALALGLVRDQPEPGLGSEDLSQVSDLEALTSQIDALEAEIAQLRSTT